VDSDLSLGSQGCDVQNGQHVRLVLIVLVIDVILATRPILDPLNHLLGRTLFASLPTHWVQFLWLDSKAG
jgi:hypothetical protein